MTDVVVREAGPDDRETMLDLLSASLGWSRDGRHDAFFSWKHDENHFGPSIALVATIDDRIVGVRLLMRWRFLLDGRPVDAVRAVDTATDPGFQGRGIFRTLTTAAVEQACDQGVGFVFNTPNDKSRPGYLKMGWELAGRVGVSVLPRGPAVVPRMLRSRAPADKWGLPIEGFPTIDEAHAAGLLDRTVSGFGSVPGVTTDRSAAYLRWRYGHDALGYRAAPVGPDGRDGLIVFRLRRRGHLVEASIAETLVTSSREFRRTIRQLLDGTGADLAVAAGHRTGLVPVPWMGPLLTTRTVTRPAPGFDRLRLSLGDVELF